MLKVFNNSCPLHVVECLKRRKDNIETVRKEVLAWQKVRNNKNVKINWQFTTEEMKG